MTAMTDPNPIPGVTDHPCQCHGSAWVPTPADCMCQRTERMLRAYGHDEKGELPALTPEQRTWCLDEIGRIEGYNRADHEADSDHWLAKTVLYAWQDYCRDKGLM